MKVLIEELSVKRFNLELVDNVPLEANIYNQILICYHIPCSFCMKGSELNVAKRYVVFKRAPRHLA
jgi:hypothetical protein